MSNIHSPQADLSNDEVLYHLLKKERSQYKSILMLTRLEHDKLTSDTLPGELHPLLNKKKLIILNIRNLENARLFLIKKWNGSKKQSTVSIEIQKELDTIQDFLKEIFQLDILNQQLIEKQRAFLQDKLQTTHMTATV